MPRFVYGLCTAVPPIRMDPRECGNRVLAGIRRNDLYILTHPEFKQGVEERFQAILASFPDEPLNTARAETVPFLLSNPIFREALEKPAGGAEPEPPAA